MPPVRIRETIHLPPTEVRRGILRSNDAPTRAAFDKRAVGAHDEEARAVEKANAHACEAKWRANVTSSLKDAFAGV